MRALICLIAAGLSLTAWAAKADEVANQDAEAIDESVVTTENEYEKADVAPSEPNTLMRLKSGVTFSRDDFNSSTRVPVTLDWEYVGFQHIGLGASFSSVGWALGAVDYRYQIYPIRFTAGVRAGNYMFRHDAYTQNRAAVGTAFNFDYAVSGPFFVNVSADFLLAEDSTRVGAFQVGFGADF